MCDIDVEMFGYIAGGWGVFTGVYAYRNWNRFLARWLQAFSGGIGILVIGVGVLCLITSFPDIMRYLVSAGVIGLLGLGWWLSRRAQRRKAKRRPTDNDRSCR